MKTEKGSIYDHERKEVFLYIMIFSNYNSLENVCSLRINLDKNSKRKHQPQILQISTGQTTICLCNRLP